MFPVVPRDRWEAVCSNVLQCVRMTLRVIMSQFAKHMLSVCLLLLHPPPQTTTPPPPVPPAPLCSEDLFTETHTGCRAYRLWSPWTVDGTSGYLLTLTNMIA